jgi:hypothetical protein
MHAVLRGFASLGSIPPHYSVSNTDGGDKMTKNAKSGCCVEIEKSLPFHYQNPHTEIRCVGHAIQHSSQ